MLQTNIRTMRTLTLIILLLISNNTISQTVNNRINEIKDNYKEIIKNKGSYSKIIKDVTWNYFEYSEEEDRSLERIETLYYGDKHLKLKSIETSITDDYSSVEELIECYYDNDSLFFIYRRTKSLTRISFNPDNQNNTVIFVEERIYLDTELNCIKYLVKNIEGTDDKIKDLIAKTRNIEQDCSERTEFIKELTIQ